MRIDISEIFTAGIPVIFAFAAVSAWVTHIVWIIGTLASDAGATASQMVLGAIGAFMLPVGVVHGVMLWLGYGA